MLTEAFAKELRNNVIGIYKECVKSFDKEGSKILEIGIQNYNYKSFFSKALVHTCDIERNYNPDFVVDITNKQEVVGMGKDSYYDLVICCEVLEHCSQPFFAVENLHSLLKRGGSIVVSTPFNFTIHGPGMDNWRFTDQGLKSLFKDYTIITFKEFTVSGHKMPLQYMLEATRT